MERKKKSGRGMSSTGAGHSGMSSSVGEGSSHSFGLSPERGHDLNTSRGMEMSGSSSLLGEKGDMSTYHVFSEDLRISKILRRLRMETSGAIAEDLALKLQQAILDPANATYIRRVFEILTENFFDLLENAPEESLNRIAVAYGMCGYVMRHDFHIYKNCIFKSYDAMPDIRPYLMKALDTTLKYDSETLDLITYSDRLIVQLKNLLEATDRVDDFIVVSDVIPAFAKNYKKSFDKHFQDIVDIVVGWHLEKEHSTRLKQHCSKVLQGATDFFMKDLDFTDGLMSQFLEDITALGEDIENADSGGGTGSPTTEKAVSPEISVGSLIGALTSVLKCVIDENRGRVFHMKPERLQQSIATVQRVACQSLQSTSCPDTIQAINDFFVLMLTCNGNNIYCDYDELFEVIQLEMRQFRNFNDGQIRSFLFLLLYFTRELKTTVPIKFITFVLQPDQLEFASLKMTSSEKCYKLLIKLYHEILSIKNVTILQKAYKHILVDMREAMKCMKESDESKYTPEQAECIINFYLSALAVLANQTSSPICMYGLQPGVFELLIIELNLANMAIWADNPVLHHSAVNLLAVYCMKNNNYVLSSSLVQMLSKLSLDTSPMAENFSIILKFLGAILETNQLTSKTALLLLNWAQFIYHQCAQHAEILTNNESFIRIARNICRLSTRCQPDVLMSCAKCLDVLFTYHRLNTEIFDAIGEVCCIHIRSTDRHIRDVYIQLFAKLPLNVALKTAQETNGVVKCKDLMTNDLQRWYISSPVAARLRESHFRKFFEIISLKDSATYIEQFLLGIFPKCWISQKGRGADFFSLARNNLNYLLTWAEWEVAEFCVNNKLRTPFGKPQETLLNIEAMVRKGMQILDQRDPASINLGNIDSLVANQKHIRILLEFLECLEKSIYNAAEGTAFAIPAPEKPVRSFFKINTPTCREWFSRIRTAVDLVAMHSIEPEMVIRYSESVLSGLVAADKTEDPLFGHTLVLYSWALIRNNESEALHGLYVWTKRVTGKRFAWVKFAAEHAAGHREKAAEGYTSCLDDDENLDGHVRDFICDQIVECLYFTNQWELLKNFIQSRKPKIQPQLTVPQISLKYDQVECIQIFEESGDALVMSLANWDILESSQTPTNNCSFNNLMSISENTLTSIALADRIDVTRWKACAKIVQSAIEEFLLTKPKDNLNSFILMNHVAHKIRSVQENVENGHNLDSLAIDKEFGSTTLNRTLRWADFLSGVYNVETTVTMDLRLKTASVARKEGNYRLCKNVLEKFFKKTNSELLQKDLGEIGRMLISNDLETIVWNADTMRGVYEASKWLHCQPGKQEEAIQLQATCLLGALSFGPSEELSRSLLTTADWLSQGSESILTGDESSPVKVLLEKIVAVQTCSDESVEAIIPSLDKAVGKLIQCSTQTCPELAKAWSSLGSWCYRWGRKTLEQRTSGSLRSSDIDAIKLLVPDASKDDISKIIAILCQNEVIGDDEEIGPNEASSTELIESQLIAIPVLMKSGLKTVQAIVEIWRQAHKSIYAYYELAASSYFKYLTLASTADDSRKNGDCSTVTATLRLLRLIVKHALGLQEVLEEGLSTTPTHPWKVITPQLFSRLNHHEFYVRKRVSELLCRVAMDSPHLIIFPAVVGAAQETSSNDDEKSAGNNALASCFNSLLDTLSTQAPETVKQVQLLVKELKRITLLWDEYWLHSLAQLYSEYSELFRNLEAEIRKCTDDKLSLVAEKYRILMNHVVEDMNRLAETTSRPPETNYERNFQEKYSNVIQTVIDDLNKPFDREKSTEPSYRIKHLYLMFQQRLQKSSQSTLKTIDISPVLASMKNTAISMPGVEASENNPIYIKSMDSTVYILPTKTKPKKLAFFGSDGKRYTYLFKGLEDLHLDERIMQFLSIANTMISKPVEYNGHNPNYRAHHYSVIPLGPRSGLISWVDGVMPIFGLYKKWQQREAANPKKDKQFTVQRPSEMFYNKLNPLLAEHNIKTVNNRKSWPLNVLRQVLDELTKETPHDLVANELWCYSNNAASWRRAIRTYSVSVAVMSVIGYVIGLGDRHLDNVLVKLSTGEIVHIDYNVCFEKGKTLRVPEKVPFRMTPNLEKALGITGIEGTFRLACEHVLKTLRKERETLLTLLEAFVYDPLVDWAVSDDGTTSNSRATTVLAAAADIVALTANANATSIKRAAGGTEAADASSETKRRASTALNEALDSGMGTDIVTTFASLASNVPSTSDDIAVPSSSTDKKQLPSRRKPLENEVMRDTVTARFTEIKPEWTQYRNEVHEQLCQMIQYLDDLESQREQMQKDECERDLLSKQTALVREVETLGTAMSSHSINTLSQRYGVYRKVRDEYEKLQRIVSEKSSEYTNQMQAYLTTLTEISEKNVNGMQIALGNLCQLELPNEFDYVRDFLKTSAQEVMYLQADQARKELDKSFIQQSYIIKMALDALVQYYHVASFISTRQLQNHRLYKGAKWTKTVLTDPDACDGILLECNVMKTEDIDESRSEQVLNFAQRLESCWIEENFALKQTCELLQNQLANTDDLLLESTTLVIKFRETEHNSLTALLCVYLSILLETRNQYHSFQKACMINIPDPAFIVAEEKSYLTAVIEVCNILFVNTEIGVHVESYLHKLRAINSVAQSLRSIDVFFKSKFVPKLLQTIVADRTPLANAVDQFIDLQFELDELLEKYELGYDCESEYLQIVEHLQHVEESLDGEEAAIFAELDHVFTTTWNCMENCYDEMSEFVKIVEENPIADPVLHDISLNCLESPFTFRQSFKIRKLHALINTILEIKRISQSLVPSESNFDHKEMHIPIEKLLYNVTTNFLSGFGPYVLTFLINDLGGHLTQLSGSNLVAMSLDLAVPTAIENCLMQNACTTTEYTVAQQICMNLCQAVKQKTQVNYLNESITIQNEIIRYLQLLSSVHVWHHEKLLPSPAPFGHIIHKQIVLANCHNSVQNLNAWKISIQKIYDELMSFTRAVVQRLKWAVGANPSLSGLQQQFTECLEQQEVKFKGHCQIASKVLLQCTSILTYEKLNQNPADIAENDEKLTALIKQFSKKYKVYKQSAGMITPVEEGLVQLLDPEGNVDHCWINNVSGLLDEMTDAVQRKIASLEKDLVTTQDSLQMSAHKLRSLIDNELRMDVRYLLKLILKVDKNVPATRHKEFQNNYKRFLMRINDLHIKVLSKDFTQEIVKEIRHQIAELMEELEYIYDDLLKLINDDIGSEKDKERREVKLSGTPIRENKKGNQPEQKRNAYAVSVWRRIRMKLEGRDPDPMRRLTVAEQVDWMIREAMNPDNLAVLYEGWTPWV